MLILRIPRRRITRTDVKVDEYLISVGGVGMCVEKNGIHHSFIALACDKYYLRYLLNKLEHKYGGAADPEELDGQPILH